MTDELEHQVKALLLAYLRLDTDRQRLFQRALLNPQSSGLQALLSESQP